MAGETSFEKYPIYFLLAGLFLVCSFYFAVSLASDYGVQDSLVDDGTINFARIEQQVNETSEDAQAWGEAFKSDNLFVATGAIVLFSVWGIGKLIWNAVISLFTFFLDTATSVLGIPPIVTGVLMAIIILSLMFALWRKLSSGD